MMIQIVEFYFDDDLIFSLYFAINNEVDSSKIANFLVNQKFTISYPRIIAHQQPLDFVEFNNQNVLFSFYHKIKIEKSKDIIRILHFGDSQIEGDRISSVLREELQKIWGGSGTGFLPLSENNLGKPSAQIQLNNWQKSIKLLF